MKTSTLASALKANLCCNHCSGLPLLPNCHNSTSPLYQTTPSPQTTVASTMGSYSFCTIFHCLTILFHSHIGQWGLYTAPQAQLPEASVSKITLCLSKLGSKPTLFHCFMKLCHHCRSKRISAFNLTKWSRSQTDVICTMIRLTNLHPGCTTLAAC